MWYLLCGKPALLSLLSLVSFVISPANAKTYAVDCGNYARTGVQEAVNKAVDNDVIVITGKCQEDVFISKSIYLSGDVSQERAAIVNGRIKLVKGRTKLKNLFVYGKVSVTDSSALVAEGVIFDNRGAYALSVTGNSHAEVETSTTLGPVEVTANSSISLSKSGLSPGSSIGGHGAILDISGSSYAKISSGIFASDLTFMRVEMLSVVEIIGGSYRLSGAAESDLGLICSNSIVRLVDVPFAVDSDYLPLDESCILKQAAD